MGYCIQQVTADFHIPSANVEAAHKAILNLMGCTEAGTGGEWTGGKKVGSWFSWVSTQEARESKDLTNAMKAWRWAIDFSEAGDVNSIIFCGEKYGDDNLLFDAIAPFVTSGSFIEMQGEDGARWRWLFENNACREQDGKIVWD